MSAALSCLPSVSRHLKNQTHLSTVAACIAESSTTRLSPTELSIVSLLRSLFATVNRTDLRLVQAFIEDTHQIKLHLCLSRRPIRWLMVNLSRENNYFVSPHWKQISNDNVCRMIVIIKVRCYSNQNIAIKIDLRYINSNLLCMLVFCLLLSAFYHFISSMTFCVSQLLTLTTYCTYKRWGQLLWRRRWSYLFFCLVITSGTET